MCKNAASAASQTGSCRPHRCKARHSSAAQAAERLDCNGFAKNAEQDSLARLWEGIELVTGKLHSYIMCNTVVWEGWRYGAGPQPPPHTSTPSLFERPIICWSN